MSATSLNRPIVEKGSIYNFLCVGGGEGGGGGGQ